MEQGKNGSSTHTAGGEPRGFIDFAGLRQLWVHTGTQCNLQCSNCFEQAGPGNARIAPMTLAEAAPMLDKAAGLGVELFGFTGGEPFANPQFPSMLEYGLRLAPCLVLSNGTEPLRENLAVLRDLAAQPARPVSDGQAFPLTIRISLDTPEEAGHDAERGKGRFAEALETLGLLHGMGIRTAVARRKKEGEDSAGMSRAYAALFAQNGLPEDLPVAAFPDLRGRGETPEISENCISTYHTRETCAAFMCAHSRMLAKREGRLGLYACTLVDDDPAYDFGPDLEQALHTRTLLRHKRCFSCFAGGVSCGG